MTGPPDLEGIVFNAARRLPVGQRADYLDEACGGDAALRRAVEELLRAHEEAGAFLGRPAPGAESFLEAEAASRPPGTTGLPAVPAEKPGDRIGRYKLLQQIGEGGCGVVYMAEQQEPLRRQVALKVIKLGMDTKNVIARFDAERQALAMMDHPNIAKVLDAGATEQGRPFFVMELVRGIKITEFCDRQDLSTSDRLGLFVQVCQAVQHAHQKGVIHRDLKPSNILVTLRDSVPVSKVIDFGIAKATTGQRLTDLTVFTAFEQFIGTPAYMSPEQADMSELGVDTRSDIYSLGVLLYELLTGKTPFDTKELHAAGLDAMLRTIREREPARPSTRLTAMSAADLRSVTQHRQTEVSRLIHSLRGELDWIVMKALDKDRTRRYQTANGMATDVQRYLNGEPIVARPPSQLYVLGKSVRRHKLVVGAALVVTISLIVALVVAMSAAFRIQRDNRQIRKARDEATETLWASYLSEARATRNSSLAGRRFNSLEAVRKAAAIRPDAAVRDEAIACMVSSDLRESKYADLKRHVPVDLVCYDFKLEKYAIGESNGNIRVRAVAGDEVLAVLPAPGWSVRWVRSFSADSRYLLAFYYHGNPLAYSAWVWDLEKQAAVLKELPGEWAANFSSDSRFFARCHPGGTISIYDLGSGKELDRLSGSRPFNKLILSPDNTRLACSSEDDPRVEVREVESGRILTNLVCPAGVSCLAWTDDGKRLAAACMDNHIYLWSAEGGSLVAKLEGHEGYITSLVFNHAGNLLASASVVSRK